MKKVAQIVVTLLIFTSFIYSNNQARLLRIEQAPGWTKGKPELLLTLSDLENVLDEAAIEPSKEEIHIRIFNPEGMKILKLGHLKKGKLKWYTKLFQKKFLIVKPDKADAESLWQEVSKNLPQSRYQLILTANQKDSETVQIINKFRLSFHPHIDLNAVMTYPIAAAPGDRLKRKVSVTIYNEGNIPAENFYIESILSTDQKIPVTKSEFARNFKEDVQLKDGRMMVELLKPGHSITMAFDGAMIIPKDTPPGKYYLGLILDPENLIAEDNESNNHLARMIIITENPEKILSKINDTPVVIPQKKK